MKGAGTEKNKRRRLSAKERKKVFDTYKGHCAYCGTKITFRSMQIDHKKPLMLNSSDTLENMLPACRSCNRYKHTLDVEGFREYLAGIPKRLRRTAFLFRSGNGSVWCRCVRYRYSFTLRGWSMSRVQDDLISRRNVIQEITDKSNEVVRRYQGKRSGKQLAQAYLFGMATALLIVEKAKGEIGA